jgi:drug/metabolite transporter (DMT)-like permease
MKTTHRILGAIWMTVCVYFLVNLVQAVYRFHPDQLDTLSIDLFFALLYLAGAVAGLCLLIGRRWPRIVVSIVALLTVTASLMGLFAFFNALPYSFVGIGFDIFALASAGILLFSRKYAVA